MSTTSSTQTILPTPERSRLRKMSTNTVIANQIQMIQKKKTKNDQNTWPSPKAASTGIPLEYCFRVGLPRVQGKAKTDPIAVWHGASRPAQASPNHHIDKPQFGRLVTARSPPAVTEYRRCAGCRTRR